MSGRLALKFGTTHIDAILSGDKTLTIRAYPDVPVGDLLDACALRSPVDFETPDGEVFATAILDAVWLTNVVNVASSEFTGHPSINLSTIVDVKDMLYYYYGEDRMFGNKSDLVAIRFEVAGDG